MSHILSKSSHRIRWHGRLTLQPPWSMYPYNNSTSNPITPLPLYGKPPTLAASIIGRDDLAHYLPFSPFQMASESSTVQPFQMAFESSTYQCSTTFESTTFGIDVTTLICTRNFFFFYGRVLIICFACYCTYRAQGRDIVMVAADSRHVVGRYGRRSWHEGPYA